MLQLQAGGSGQSLPDLRQLLGHLDIRGYLLIMMVKEGMLYRYLVVLRAVLYSAFDLLNRLFPRHCHPASTVPEV